jgi:hypothetical protein
VSCKNSKERLEALEQYVLQSANNPATYDSSTLGPPADLETYPFNEIQALWQVDSTSAAIGVSHVSSILQDNAQSKVNQHMMELIYDEKFQAISLFAVDNVAENGNALTSVLRNTCGQSVLTEQGICGKALDKPAITYFHLSKRVGLTIALTIYCLWFALSVVRFGRPRMVYTAVGRLWEWLQQQHRGGDAMWHVNDEHDDDTAQETRREGLLPKDGVSRENAQGENPGG